MNWNGLVSMGGHAPYVLAALAVCLGVMGCEVASLAARLRAAERAASADGGRRNARAGGAA